MFGLSRCCKGGPAVVRPPLSSEVLDCPLPRLAVTFRFRRDCCCWCEAMLFQTASRIQPKPRMRVRYGWGRHTRLYMARELGCKPGGQTGGGGLTLGLTGRGRRIGLVLNDMNIHGRRDPKQRVAGTCASGASKQWRGRLPIGTYPWRVGLRQMRTKQAGRGVVPHERPRRLRVGRGGQVSAPRARRARRGGRFGAQILPVRPASPFDSWPRLPADVH